MRGDYATCHKLGSDIVAARLQDHAVRARSGNSTGRRILTTAQQPHARSIAITVILDAADDDRAANARNVASPCSLYTIRLGPVLGPQA